VVKKHFHWRLSNDPEDFEFDLWWTDGAVQPEKLARMKPYQKINHFPGMYGLARKNYLARNLNKLRKLFPQEYDFYPQTWVLPAEHGDALKRHSGCKRKPQSGKLKRNAGKS
jgi:tubulin polyglutamylase TTLL6/13